MVDYSFLGNIGGIIVLASIFLKYISGKDKSQETRDMKFSDALDRLNETGKEQVKSSNKIADATVRQAKEAEKRNGHLAELQLEGKAASNANALAILNAVKDIKSQHIGIQKS